MQITDLSKFYTNLRNFKTNSLLLNKNGKRGLVDGIGKISKLFFGTLIEDNKTEIIERSKF